MLAMVLSQVGLPLEGIGIIMGVDRLLDMCRTAVNITGDAMVSTVVGKSEDNIDVDIYNDPDAGIVDVDEEIHVDEDVEKEFQEIVDSPLEDE